MYIWYHIIGDLRLLLLPSIVRTVWPLLWFWDMAFNFYPIIIFTDQKKQQQQIASPFKLLRSVYFFMASGWDRVKKSVKVKTIHPTWSIFCFVNAHTLHIKYIQRMTIGIMETLINTFTAFTFKNSNRMEMTFKSISLAVHNSMCVCAWVFFLSVGFGFSALVFSALSRMMENAPEFSWYSKQNDCFREFGIITKIMCAGMNAKYK